jgi:hypothetical protein
MKIPARPLLPVTLLLALGAPLAANAQQGFPDESIRGQNAQYQQGFRDGYREGMRAAQGGSSGQGPGYRPGHGPGYGQDRSIRIESAVYGSPRGTCDFTRKLAQQADGQREFAFRSGNIWCGDPGRGSDKVARIRFSCGRDTLQVEVREERSAKLRCD